MQNSPSCIGCRKYRISAEVWMSGELHMCTHTYTHKQLYAWTHIPPPDFSPSRLLRPTCNQKMMVPPNVPCRLKVVHLDYQPSHRHRWYQLLTTGSCTPPTTTLTIPPTEECQECFQVPEKDNNRNRQKPLGMHFPTYGTSQSTFKNFSLATRQTPSTLPCVCVALP